MPDAHNGPTRLRWQLDGDGEPLVLVMGLGGSARAWWRLLPHLTPHAQCLTFDHRGTGASDPIRGPIGMADLVGDTLAVMDAAGWESAHVLGVSMGGMVAQHLALDHRERVRSLLLGCTTPVSRSGGPPWRLLGATALTPFLGPERTWPLLASALYSERTRREAPERIEEDLRVRAEQPTDPRTFSAQLVAVALHDTSARLGRLEGLPVTVVHGEEDGLIPPDRGRDLASAIPGAELVMIPSCGHMLTTDAELETAGAVLAHLDARSSSRAA